MHCACVFQIIKISGRSGIRMQRSSSSGIQDSSYQDGNHYICLQSNFNAEVLQYHTSLRVVYVVQSEQVHQGTQRHSYYWVHRY